MLTPRPTSFIHSGQLDPNIHLNEPVLYSIAQLNSVRATLVRIDPRFEGIAPRYVKFLLRPDPNDLYDLKFFVLDVVSAKTFEPDLTITGHYVPRLREAVGGGGHHGVVAGVPCAIQECGIYNHTHVTEHIKLVESAPRPRHRPIATVEGRTASGGVEVRSRSMPLIVALERAYVAGDLTQYRTGREVSLVSQT